MQVGGAEKVLTDLLPLLDRNRYKITLLLVFQIGVLLKKIPDDIEILHLYTHKPKGIRRCAEHFVYGRDMLYRKDARRLVKNRKWDTIVSFMEGPALKIHNSITDKAQRNITWVHANLNVNRWTSYLYHNDKDEAADYAAMNNIVFVSQTALKAFSTRFGISDSRPRVIPNIIPVENIRTKAKEFTVDKEKPAICSVGRLVEEKRYDRLLDAFKLLDIREIAFEAWILGTGPLEKKLYEYARELSLNDKVKFLGFQSNPYPFIAKSDIFALSSDSEGYPTVICEALALRRPIVSTRISGSTDLLKDGAGILTELNAEAMADAMEQILKSPALASKLSESANKVSQNFDQSTILNEINELL